MIHVHVKRLPEDYWSRPRLQNIDSGKIYADISCGDSRYQPREYNIPGDWHSVTREGEPDCPLKPDIEFIIHV